MKPSTYIKEWCKYRKKKTMAMRDIGKLLPQYFITNTEGEIVWEDSQKVTEAYHMHGMSMRALVWHTSSFLAQCSWKNVKKGSIDK